MPLYYHCNLPLLPSDWSTLTSRLSSLAGTPSAQLTLQPPPLYRVSLPSDFPAQPSAFSPPRPAGLGSFQLAWSAFLHHPAYRPLLHALYWLPDSTPSPATSSLFMLYRSDFQRLPYSVVLPAFCPALSCPSRRPTERFYGTATQAAEPVKSLLAYVV